MANSAKARTPAETPSTTLSDRIRQGDLPALRGDVTAPACPSREILKHVTSLWGVLVLLALRDGTLRFSALRRKAAGISEKMLAQTLQALEADGFVVRTAYPVMPPHVDYRLTGLGEEVAAHVAALADWVELNFGAIVAARAAHAAKE